jgi:hypothetical protein
MAEVDFERRLERMFADAGELPDAQAFATRVERRLDRGWNLRRGLIGVAGLAGGVVGASQLIMSNFFNRVEVASRGSSRLMQTGLDQVAHNQWLASLPTGWEVAWIAGGLAVLAMAFVLTRVIEEF